jgi:hypothetical protein
VTADEVKSMCTSIEDSQSALRSNAEMNMIEMQSLVAKRATALQLTTGMMNSINEGMKAIAGNIGR